jgi:hypothetical protein
VIVNQLEGPGDMKAICHHDDGVVVVYVDNDLLVVLQGIDVLPVQYDPDPGNP